MTSVRAFVGHSFLEQDAELVRKFTDFLDTLKGGAHDFDWVHATEARPEEVSAKVQELIDGKNLFVGICTRNERVVKNNLFRPTLLRNRLTAREEDVEWKTSDWIIQEIGLAIGRGMSLLLLIEDGVRQPGGLQGNLEYISFSRELPEQAFSRILEMINALELQSGAAAEAGVPESTTSNLSNNSKRVQDKERGAPEETWEPKDYEWGYISGLLEKNEKQSNRISKAYLEKIKDKSNETQSEWNAFCELQKLRWTDHGNLDSIVKFATAHKNNSIIQSRAAHAYLFFDDTKNAKKHFRQAVDCEDDTAQKIVLLGEIAQIEQKSEDQKKLLSIVEEMRNLTDAPKLENKLLAILASLSGWYKDEKLKIAMLERELAINPTDTQNRFQLAYLHSQNNNEDLAMYHYEKIPLNKRDGTTWNNLGVSYQHFNMQAKSVAAYKNAAKKGETLAMSNIAYLLMNSGFMHEAKERIEEAQQRPNYHDSVVTSLTRLNEIPNEENKTHKEKLKGTGKRSDFFSYVGEHVWKTTPKQVPQKMVDKNCVLDVSLEDGTFFATGTFNKETKGTDLADYLASANTPAKPEKYRVEYSGQLVGSVIIGNMTKIRLAESQKPSSLSGLFPFKAEFILILPDSPRHVRGMIENEVFDVEFKEGE